MNTFRNWRAPDTKTLTDRNGADLGTIKTFGGWEWETNGTSYRTNEEGEGLFEWTGSEWRQLAGTAQFCLSADRNKALRDLRRQGHAAD